MNEHRVGDIVKISAQWKQPVLIIDGVITDVNRGNVNDHREYEVAHDEHGTTTNGYYYFSDDDFIFNKESSFYCVNVTLISRQLDSLIKL